MTLKYAVDVVCHTVYPKKYAHGFCFAVLCCGYTLTDFPISIRLTSLALWQSNDCPSASKATLMNMDKYFMWIHYERLHNHNKAKHNETVCIFLGIYCREKNASWLIGNCGLRIYHFIQFTVSAIWKIIPHSTKSLYKLKLFMFNQALIVLIIIHHIIIYTSESIMSYERLRNEMTINSNCVMLTNNCKHGKYKITRYMHISMA